MASLALTAQPRRSRGRIKRLGVILLVIAAVLALAAWLATILLRPHPPSPESITQAMRAQAALSGGAKVYATYCAYCHDTGFAPALAGLHLPYEAVRSFVRIGPGMMQAFSPSQVSDADIDAVARYIDTLPPHQAASK